MDESVFKVQMITLFVTHAVFTLGVYLWRPGRFWLYFLLLPFVLALVLGTIGLLAIGVSFGVDGLKARKKAKLKAKRGLN